MAFLFIGHVSYLQSMSCKGKKHQHYSKLQEVVHKDVGCCFGVLQLKWQIVINIYQLWDHNVFTYVLMACIILHNIVIKDKQGDILELTIEVPNAMQTNGGLTFVEFVDGTKEVENQ